MLGAGGHSAGTRCALMVSISALLTLACAASALQADTGAASAAPQGREVAVLAGGCFWAMEARFKLLKGVSSVTPGYAGGRTPNPTYEQVCSDTTGYAEAVQIVFDPSVLPYRQLVDIFMHVHDPTTRDRQGNDVGNSYRSAIFYRGASQKAAALDVIRQIEAAHVWPAPIVTEVVPYTNFYRAESYHVDYFARHPENPYCQYVVAPEVSRFRERYRALLK